MLYASPFTSKLLDQRESSEAKFIVTNVNKKNIEVIEFKYYLCLIEE